jgi:hypothetical protein
MSAFDLLHFDTNDNNSLFTTNNCYDTTFTLASTYKNIRKINLCSLEMPIVFTNIRSDNTSNLIWMAIGGTTHLRTLSNANYTSITALLTEINRQFSNLPASILPTFSLVNNYIIKISTPTPTTIQIFDSLLANMILGFPKGFYNVERGNVAYITGANSFNLNYDNFIALYLNIPSTCTSSGNHLISYKIPLNAVSGMVYYLGQNNTFEQSVVLTDKNFVLRNFRIQVFDRFGYPITQATDYTFSLSFFYYEDETQYLYDMSN